VDSNEISQIWVKNLAQGDPIQITSGDVAASQPAWSPKNDQIVFSRRGQGLWSVPPLGGPARRLVEFGTKPRFSNDGERIVFDKDGQEIWTARADGSELARVHGVPEPWYALGLDPAFSPDGASIVYVMPELGPNGDLWIIPTAGGTPRRLTFDLTVVGGPLWTPDGAYIVFTSMRAGSRNLWRVAAAGGEPQPITVGAGEDIEPSLSRDGRTLVYTNVRNVWRLQVLNPVTRQERTIVERHGRALWPRFSPDGSAVAFFGYADAGDVQVFVIPAAGGPVHQITYGKAHINTMPRWSRDGSVIYYYEQRPAESLKGVPAAGGVGEEIRKWRWESHTSAEFSPDGTHIAYVRGPAPGEAPIPTTAIVQDLKSGGERVLAVPLRTPRWSPDGRTIAGRVNAGRSGMVVTCTVESNTCRSLTPGFSPVWSPDGSRIYFLRDTDSPTIKELWSITAEGDDARRIHDRMGPYGPVDITFDIAPNGEIVWNQFIEGKYELWQAALR
jgi:Tol biopolymer transport system component